MALKLLRALPAVLAARREQLGLRRGHRTRQPVFRPITRLGERLAIFGREMTFNRDVSAPL
jgi:hypothetical protein